MNIPVGTPVAGTPTGHPPPESGTVPVACEATSLSRQESDGSTAAFSFSTVSFVPKILRAPDDLLEARRPLSHSLARGSGRYIIKDKPRMP